MEFFKLQIAIVIADYFDLYSKYISFIRNLPLN